VAGGAIISRWGQASFKRGLARPFTKFLVGVNCPILHTVHGRAVCELGPKGLPIAEDTWIMGTSNCATPEGWAQVRPTLEEAGIIPCITLKIRRNESTSIAGYSDKLNAYAHGRVRAHRRRAVGRNRPCRRQGDHHPRFHHQRVSRTVLRGPGLGLLCRAGSRR